nr:MAG TPA: hypothetical protein [Caudoviricetes sp.]
MARVGRVPGWLHGSPPFFSWHTTVALLGGL